MSNLYKTDRVCPICGKPMIVDNVDYNFTGNYNKHLTCIDEKCRCVVRELYRYNQLWKVITFDSSGSCIDEEVKKIARW